MPAAPTQGATRALGDRSALVKDNLYALRGGRHIYTSPWINEGPLKRCSASIGLTIGYEPFEVTVGNMTRHYQAAAVRSTIERCLRAEDIGIIGFQFDPSHPDFPRFRAIPAPGVLALVRERFAPFDEEFRAAYRGELTPAGASDLFDRVAARALTAFPASKPVDRRVQHVIELLWENHNCQLRELAAAVGLSYYRLSHLFAENIGMTLRSYQQWRRVRKAISLSKYDYSLTKIAHDAGFTDSAHLCRTFQQLHAAPPSYFFNQKCVRIISPEPEAGKTANEIEKAPTTAAVLGATG